MKPASTKPVVIFVAGLLVVALAAGCGRDDPSESVLHPSVDADSAGHGEARTRARDAALTAELQAYEAAEPVFEKHCARCHEPGAPQANASALRRFSMEEYPFGGLYARELGDVIPRAVGAGEHRATMPRDDPGALSDDELARIVEWAEAHERARAAGAHRDSNP